MNGIRRCKLCTNEIPRNRMWVKNWHKYYRVNPHDYCCNVCWYEAEMRKFERSIKMDCICCKCGRIMDRCGQRICDECIKKEQEKDNERRNTNDNARVSRNSQRYS